MNKLIKMIYFIRNKNKYSNFKTPCDDRDGFPKINFLYKLKRFL